MVVSGGKVVDLLRVGMLSSLGEFAISYWADFLAGAFLVYSFMFYHLGFQSSM